MPNKDTNNILFRAQIGEYMVVGNIEISTLYDDILNLLFWASYKYIYIRQRRQK